MSSINMGKLNKTTVISDFKSSLMDFKQQLDYYQQYADAGKLSKYQLIDLERYQNTLVYYRDMYQKRLDYSALGMIAATREVDKLTKQIMVVNEDLYN
ncbi:TPA: hypothetical protein ACGWER_001720 [Streptococcus agalactiae]|nr:hypothetical protein [Streptococcus agalactiae]HEO2267369.1 hypothetical protein [Streptococcus agalactiae]